MSDDDSKIFGSKFFGKQCFYCGAQASSMDHVKPKKYGGTDEESNLVPACWTCNSEKRGREFWEWFRDLVHDRRIFKKRLDQISAIAKRSVPIERSEVCSESYCSE